MKKHLLLTALLMSPIFALIYFARADTVTSGNVGLLIPSTGVADTTRNWADKYNENFRIIASTLGTSVSDINGKISAGTGNAGVIVDSMTTGLLQNGPVLRASHTVSGVANGLVQNNIGVIVGSMTAGLMANDGPVLRASHTISGAAGGLVQNNAHVIVSSMISGGLTFMTVSEDGTSEGNINVIDFTDNMTLTVSGTTATVSSSGGGAVQNTTESIRMGGGGEIVLSTAPNFVPGTFALVQKSTLNVIDVHAFVAPASTYAASMFRVVVGSSIQTMSARSQHIVVGTDSQKSVTFSTSFPIFPGDLYGLEISTCPDKSGVMPTNFGVTLRYWKGPEQYP